MKKAILALLCIALCMPAAAADKLTADDVKRETPAYEAVADVVDAIVAQYPGKVIFVDFWATWCGPCLRAMQTMQPLKPWMEENDVVRVYLSLSSSDPTLWEQMIGDIGGEHYFLTKEENAAVGKRYGMSGVPTYQIYNTKGELHYQNTGYPGNEVVAKELKAAKL